MIIDLNAQILALAKEGKTQAEIKAITGASWYRIRIIWAEHKLGRWSISKSLRES